MKTVDVDLVQTAAEGRSARMPALGRFWRGTRGVLSRRRKDLFAARLMALLATFTSLLVPALILALYVRTRPILVDHSPGELLLSTTWKPLSGLFGFFPFIAGSLWVTLVAMAMAVPLSLLVAIYLAEYAPARTRAGAKPVIDLLAGIPSVVYGVWGVLLVVPAIQSSIAPFCSRWLGFVPLFASDNPTGYGLLAGGLVLAVMVLPVIIAVSEEVIRSVPRGLREASLALGATRWQTTKHVVLRRARSGILAAVVLGFSRAFGETMAVLMVVGNVAQIPRSIFDPAYPLPALIANNYGEMMSIPLYDSALMGAALILLLIVLVFSLLSRLALVRLSRHE
jgi:phosphate transport system permease protein